MKKLFLLMFIFSFSNFLWAQKDNNQISAGLELGMPMGLLSNGLGAGVGVTGKGLYGVGESGQVSFTLGYIHYGMSGNGEGISAGMGVIPIIPGYRQYFNNVYAEGQLGLAIVNSSFNVGGWGGSFSSTNASYAIGGGYIYDKLDFSLRYQSYGLGFGTLGLRAAYNISLDF